MDLKKFRDPEIVSSLLKEIHLYKDPLNIMEVCGSHTMAIGHWGIRKLLPENIRLISGPGCPVCVTPAALIDQAAQLRNVALYTFGDLIRVPGNITSLEKARSEGADIRIAYSPLEALQNAEQEETVFIGIGFETTIPGIAYTILEAAKRKLSNFSVLPAFKTVPPALKAILSSDDSRIDGFLLPGHVSVILGEKDYQFLVEDFKVGGVICGFEPVDILLAIKKLIDQKYTLKPGIDNEYSRVVSAPGNLRAKEVINQVLEPVDAVWRGLGTIPASGLGIRSEYSQYDTSRKYDLKIDDTEIESSCRCGDVLKGKILPSDCPLFAEVCEPSNPIGPCMVSSEGSCAAYYKYER
ncbi:hydrogenase formation protein HypD [Candidatus Cloacimonadota bacterium]